MAETVQARKLASIVAIDVAGYSRRTEADEEAAIKAVAALRGRIAATAETHAGRVFNTAGDGFMLEFPTASGALAAAEEIAGAGDPPVRVGVHLGEVSVTESGDLLGHGVNVAARIQQMASPGAVLVSGDVKRAIRSGLVERLKPQGSVRLDKMSETLPVFALAPAVGGRAKGRRRDLRLPAAAAGALVLVLLGAGLWLARGSWPWGSPKPARIAIMPFSANGGGDQIKTFASSFTDDLASVLSGNGRPIVIGGEAQPLSGPGGPDLIRKLGVRLIFTGSVEQLGDELRVRVRLDDAQHGVTVWTADMDSPSSQSEHLEAQLGARVIAVLNCTSRALRPRNGFSDPEAMTLLLKACDIFEDQVGAGDDPGRIFALFDTTRELTQKVPGFAAGHSLLARFDAYYRVFLPPSMNDQLVAEARSEIDKALRIDPDDIDVHVARYLLTPTADFRDRDRTIMGVAFDPSWPYGDIFKSAFLGDVGREKEALAANQRAVAANPLSTDEDSILALLTAGQQAAAEKELARVTRLWPASFVWAERLNLQEADGDWAGLKSFEDDPAQRPKTMTDADGALQKLVDTAARTRNPSAVARARATLLNIPSGERILLGKHVLALAWIGDVDDAFAVAGRMSRADLSLNNPPLVLFLPQAAGMRRDPRFIALADHFGLLDYWRSTGHWPDFCSDPGLPYDCKAEAAKLGGKTL